MSTTTTATVSAPAPAPAKLSSALDCEDAGSDKFKRLHQIPVPESKEAARQWQLEQMAAAFRIFAKLGFADGSSGHISLRDPVRPDTFWINPYGVHFGLLKVSDMVHIDEDGNRIGGADKPVNTAGFTIHSVLHQRRPDINAACHMHSPYGRAWSTFGRPIEMLNQGRRETKDSCMFYNDLSVYQGFGGVVLAKEEGEHIADALGPTNKNIILQNHGLLTAGGTVGEAAGFFIALERACQTQLLVDQATAPGTNGAANGLKKTLVGDEEAQFTKDGTGTPEVMYIQFEPEYQLILKETGGDFLL
ncbi:class II Aldolase and Adducin domain-containing protein [Colletotrichum graminicola]|nr:class II Aldolase and Adducin domain-containing protein [Colletotrichum graminicola]